MIDPKRNLYSFMRQHPGSFVGFFSLVSEILKDLGMEWLEFAKANADEQAKDWAIVFLNSAKTIQDITVSLDKVRIEYDNREDERANPIDLVKDFKAKVERIKNGSVI